VEGALADRQSPGEHLQAEEAEVFERDQGGQGDGEGFHGCAPGSESSAINADPSPPAKSDLAPGGPRVSGAGLRARGQGRPRH
jgi:hypothetical protein